MEQIQKHPHWQEEEKHLADTLQVVAEEKQKLEDKLGIVDGNDRLIHVLDDGSSDAVVQQFLVKNQLRSLHQLRLSQRQPYFARLDFTPDPGRKNDWLKVGELSKVYVGRWGVIQTPEYKVWVADWRSPVANLYYSGQVGRVSYECPDGSVYGELSLKRMLTVEDGILTGLQDTGLAGQEKFLTDALSQLTSSRLREVVTTIQAEQNAVIRAEPMQPLCVQGVAGSGKTTIALHRIAWILYRLQKTLQPQQLLIIAPNPLFLSYISKVLPDLGVDDVRQVTFEGLCKQLLGKHMPRLQDVPQLRLRLGMTKPQRDQLDDTLLRKGSLALYDRLQDFLAYWEEACLPTEDIRLGNTVLMTAAEVRRYCMTDFRHFPLAARIGELIKVIRNRVKTVVEKLHAAITEAAEKKLDQLLHAMPDSPERRQKATLLLNSRDQRIDELEQLGKTFPKQVEKLFGTMELLEVYRLFWQRLAQSDAACASAAETTLPLLEKKRAAREDLPALLVLARGLYGLNTPDVRHVVIDEAQDVPPLQVKILREIFGHDAFTLVGDLCQGICGDGGIRQWSDLSAGIFKKPVETVALSTAYRSTAEITDAALSVIARHPVDGVGHTQPVLRHGDKPLLVRCQNQKSRTKAVLDILRGWQNEGYRGIGVAAKDPKAAKALHKALLDAGLTDARLVTEGDPSFEGGIQVMDAGVVKGLEFDCMLIADADAETYPDQRFYAKLFYVLCTRPLHRLALCCTGEPTAHLANADLAVREA
ncbi:MAG: AAA family ATPase [Clostridia bacterium]|nr:AAA family ATPase [Clostridia bacterium]